MKNVAIGILSLILFISVILLLLCGLKNRNHKNDFVNTIRDIKLPILTKLMNNRDGIDKDTAEKIFDMNKQQVNCVFSNRHTRDLFKEKIDNAACVDNNIAAAIKNVCAGIPDPPPVTQQAGGGHQRRYPLRAFCTQVKNLDVKPDKDCLKSGSYSDSEHRAVSSLMISIFKSLIEIKMQGGNVK